MNGDKIRVHYTGVDQNRFDISPIAMAAKQAAGARRAGPVILSVGALIARQGRQELIVRALASDPGRSAVVLAGDGPTRESHSKRVGERTQGRGSA